MISYFLFVLTLVVILEISEMMLLDMIAFQCDAWMLLLFSSLIDTLMYLGQEQLNTLSAIFSITKVAIRTLSKTQRQLLVKSYNLCL